MTNISLFVWALVLVLLVWDYLNCRTKSVEDRYMALYGRRNWDSCNMELRLSFDRENDRQVKSLFRQRLADHLCEIDPKGSLFHETPRVHRRQIDFHYDAGTSVQDLRLPRKGLYWIDDDPGTLSIVWNHIQSDGIRLWQTLRPLFDTNPSILDFHRPKKPPAFWPELLAIPTTMRRIFFRYNLNPPRANPLHYGFSMWRTRPIRQIKAQKRIPLNTVMAALIINELFRTHTHITQLTVGLTVAFTFLEAKNQYGLITLKINRADFDGICRQIKRQIKDPMRTWGTFSTQSYLLSFFPDWLFKKIMGYFRGQVDVLISSLPVGRKGARINGVPITISCYPKELTIPYYFLLMASGPHIHMSFTSKYGFSGDFMNQDKAIAAV